MIYLAVAVALMLSSISAYFSVLGFTALFPGSFLPIIVMASSLELAKIITVVWLHQHWKDVSWFIRSYLSASVIILMIITSLGVFGFLSKAHIKYQLNIDSGIGEQIALLEAEITNKEKMLADTEKEITLIDGAAEKLFDLSKKVADAKTAIRERDKNKKERTKLLQQKTDIEKEIAELKTEHIQIKTKYSEKESEVGPIKYAADLIFGKATKEQLERTIRYAILLLVFIFDPLAIVLLLGASSIYKKRSQHIIEIDKKKVAVVDIDNILKIK